MDELYDITKPYEENLTYGPRWSGPLPKISAPVGFLGHRVNSLFGISACPLTVNARFVALCSRLGFDILTYKSVRSVEWHGNTFPHWLYVDAPASTDPVKKKSFKAGFGPFPRQEPSMVNSFGIHSVKPQYWQAEFREALGVLQPGQLLILSMQTTPIAGKTIIDDARDLAKLAREVSAPAVEINFACPNTDEGKGMIFDDVDLAPKVCEAMKGILGAIPLLIKVGFYRDDQTIQTIMKRTKGIIAGIATANTFPGKIVDNKGRDMFPGRPYAGVSGAVIRDIAMGQAKKIVEIKRELDLVDLVVIGIGGVTKPHHISDYLSLGVDAVQSAAGAYADPYLALRYKRSLFDL